jgi:hypothetical protein
MGECLKKDTDYFAALLSSSYNYKGASYLKKALEEGKRMRSVWKIHEKIRAPSVVIRPTILNAAQYLANILENDMDIDESLREDIQEQYIFLKSYTNIEHTYIPENEFAVFIFRIIGKYNEQRH